MDKLRGFGIKNFRSFDEEGIFLDNIEKVNIFIGKNNSGKSNVLKFLNNLSKFTQTAGNEEFPNKIENQYKRNGQITTFLTLLTHEDLGFPIEAKNKIDEPLKVEYELINGKVIKNNIFDSLDVNPLNRCIDEKRDHIWQSTSQTKGSLLLEELIGDKNYIKVKDSKKIVKNIDKVDLDILDLKEQINNLVKKIKEWNS